MASKPSRTTNFREQGKRLLAMLSRDFPEVESKGYGRKTLAKKTKAWEEILTKFNSQNLNGMKRDLSQLQGMLEAAETPVEKGTRLTSS